MAWLRDLTWPVEAAIFDGEAVAGDGHEGIQAVFNERNRDGGSMAVILFDVLSLEGQSVMGEPWTGRRKRLEDVLDGRDVPGVRLVPYTEDAAGLWDTWVGMGGEGIVLKDRSSIYRPGVRSPAWLKLKPKVVLRVTLTGQPSERIRGGDWSQAMMLDFRYTHPRTGQAIEARQAVRVPRDQDIALRVNAAAEIVCWAIMPSGLLRHPLLLASSAHRPPLFDPHLTAWKLRRMWRPTLSCP